VDLVPCPLPKEKLPAWVRPWPGDGSDTERIDWFLELEHCARKAGGREHFAEFCRARALEIAANIQHGLIVGLTENNKTLRKKMEQKVDLASDAAVAKIVDAVFAEVEKRVAASIEQKLTAAVKAIELRFKQQKSYEDTVAKKIGDLGNAVDQLDRRLGEEEWRIR
jgi:hypothetical protein